MLLIRNNNRAHLFQRIYLNIQTIHMNWKSREIKKKVKVKILIKNLQMRGLNF